MTITNCCVLVLVVVLAGVLAEELAELALVAVVVDPTSGPSIHPLVGDWAACGVHRAVVAKDCWAALAVEFLAAAPPDLSVALLAALVDKAWCWVVDRDKVWVAWVLRLRGVLQQGEGLWQVLGVGCHLEDQGVLEEV